MRGRWYLPAVIVITPRTSRWATTATQGGHLAGLVLIVPFDRRRIMLVQLIITAIGFKGAAAAPSAWTFPTFSVVTGAASMVVQEIIAFAMAPWHLTAAQIGMFGVFGAAGALGAAGARRWADISSNDVRIAGRRAVA